MNNKQFKAALKLAFISQTLSYNEFLGVLGDQLKSAVREFLVEVAPCEMCNGLYVPLAEKQCKYCEGQGFDPFWNSNAELYKNSK